MAHREIPDFVVIGAMKAGTTFLWTLLQSVDGINFCSVKEANFFNDNPKYGGTWDRGPQWYEDMFRRRPGLCGEASTAYSKYPYCSGVARRLHSLAPNAKIIYLVRDPVERSISHYLHNVVYGREERMICDALLKPIDNQYIEFGLYYKQIEQYLEFFPANQILILQSKQLWLDSGMTLRRVCSFLKIPEVELPSTSFQANATLPRILRGTQRAPSNRAQAHLFTIARALSQSAVTPTSDIGTALGFQKAERAQLAELMREDASKLAQLDEHIFPRAESEKGDLARTWCR